MVIETGEKFADAVENRIDIAVTSSNQRKTPMVESIYVSITRLEEWKSHDYILRVCNSEAYCRYKSKIGATHLKLVPSDMKRLK